MTNSWLEQFKQSINDEEPKAAIAKVEIATAFNTAVMNGKIDDMTEMLYENEKTILEIAPASLEIAAEHGQKEAADFILNHASANINAAAGMVAISTALEHNHFEIAKAIQKKSGHFKQF